ncbi:replication initiator protein [Microviridae sp.]|nr:replication initiator protein [Microviridae sp.]
MACDTPILLCKEGHQINGKGKVYHESLTVPCGKCPPCKLRRVQEWVFRLQQQEKISTNAHFVTLTYNTYHVPISDNGFMTLKKSDFQTFIKRLRKTQKTPIKYYACGEYGTKRKRPHYHAIIFNVEDSEHIVNSWTIPIRKNHPERTSIGTVHVGTVSGNSIAYTAKYIDKDKTIPLHKNDDRIPEFSLMSKGLGLNYLTDAMKQYYKNDPSRLHVYQLNGHTSPLPRYFKKKLWNEYENELKEKYQDEQFHFVKKLIKEQEEKERKKFYLTYKNSNKTYEQWKDTKRRARHSKFKRSKNGRDQD